MVEMYYKLYMIIYQVTYWFNIYYILQLSKLLITDGITEYEEKHRYSILSLYNKNTSIMPSIILVNKQT